MLCIRTMHIGTCRMYDICTINRTNRMKKKLNFFWYENTRENILLSEVANFSQALMSVV